MTKGMIKTVLIGAALALGGCAAKLPPVEATRFHLGQPIAAGTIHVEPLPGSGGGLELQTYMNAVQGELVRLGYPVSSAEAAGYIVTVAVERDTREALAARSPVSVGVGGAAGGYGSGLGVGVGISLGGRARDTIITELRVQMKQRMGGGLVWEGRAQMEARDRTPAAQPGIAAGKLAGALFKGFPGESGRTISVP